MQEITVPAEVDALAAVTGFIESQLEEHGCPPGLMMQMTLAVEELFVNIAKYAYPPAGGRATIRCRVETGAEHPQVVIQFLDRGKPYNPLERDDPDVTVPVEERGIGGLGIFLVKQTMDAIAYEYRDGQNILTIRKNLDAPEAPA